MDGEQVDGDDLDKELTLVAEFVMITKTLIRVLKETERDKNV